MSFMDARQRAELDRYITGNYGEDQFREEIECRTCSYPIVLHGETWVHDRDALSPGDMPYVEGHHADGPELERDPDEQRDAEREKGWPDE